MALGYAFAALVCFVLVVTIPLGVAALRIAVFALWPFGKTIVPKPGAGAGSLFLNAFWLVFFGWWLALGHLFSGLLLCLTVIGIPLGLANFKLIPVSLVPFGKDVVSAAEAQARGFAPFGAAPR